MSLTAVSDLTFHDELHSSLQHGHFHMVYQPQVNLLTREVDGFEALIRWTHPAFGRVAPSDFVIRAEALKLVHHLDHFALMRACEDALDWPEEIRISVNLSASQFSRPWLARDVHSAVARTGLHPQRLEIEITETSPITDPGQFTQNSEDIAALGIALAVDDFGTGFTSLQVLNLGRFSKIKLDAAFVQNIVGESKSQAIAKAVATLGRDLCLTTVAEGLESVEQVSHITSLGYTGGQGYIFAPPMPAHKIAAFLTAFPS